MTRNFKFFLDFKVNKPQSFEGEPTCAAARRCPGRCTSSRQAKHAGNGKAPPGPDQVATGPPSIPGPAASLQRDSNSVVH